MDAAEENLIQVWPPTMSPLPQHQHHHHQLMLRSHRDDYYDPNWKQLDNSVNAVSFGFVATAILISMFLIMAIFERFLRPVSSTTTATSAAGASSSDLGVRIEMGFESKLDLASPKMSVYSRGVSVLMPGEDTPTFIAHPVPSPASCPQECIHCPLHQPVPPSISSNTQSTISGIP